MGGRDIFYVLFYVFISKNSLYLKFGIVFDWIVVQNKCSELDHSENFLFMF